MEMRAVPSFINLHLDEFSTVVSSVLTLAMLIATINVKSGCIFNISVCGKHSVFISTISIGAFWKEPFWGNSYFNFR